MRCQRCGCRNESNRKCCGNCLGVLPASPPPKRCRHCDSKRAWARGLCRQCHRDPSILERFPSSQGEWRSPYEPPPPRRPAALPTSAEPGSPEKVAVLAARYAAGQELWHPLDHQDTEMAAGRLPLFEVRRGRPCRSKEVLHVG